MPSQHQQYIDNFDARSHYSDSVAINALYSVGTSGASGGSGIAGGSGVGAGGGGSLSGAGIEGVHHPIEKYPKSYSTCGTLRGSYFKSNQSLCSCNAETEVCIANLMIFYENVI